MKVVISNVYGPLNRGDHELFNTLIMLLSRNHFEVEAVARDPQLCRETFPGMTFHEQPGKTNKGPKLVQHALRIMRLMIAALATWIPGVSRLLPGAQHDAVMAIKTADLIIACPGGYLEDSTLSLYPQLVQLWLGAMGPGQLVLAPMSIGPIYSRFSRWMLARVLKRTKEIFVREAISEAFCRELGFASTRSNDLAFLSDRFATPIPTTDITARHIAVTAINWRFPGYDCAEAQSRYVSELVSTIMMVADHTGLPVKLIVQVENDLDMIQRVASKLGGISTIAHEVNTPEKIQAYLQDSYCLIASRFHSAIFALAVGCPVVALAYLPKTRGMLTLYGMDDFCFPIDRFDGQELGKTLITWGDDRAAFRQRCNSMRGRLVQTGNPFIDFLDSTASGK